MGARGGYGCTAVVAEGPAPRIAPPVIVPVAIPTTDPLLPLPTP